MWELWGSIAIALFYSVALVFILRGICYDNTTKNKTKNMK